MPKVRFSPQAIADLEEIKRYIIQPDVYRYQTMADDSSSIIFGCMGCVGISHCGHDGRIQSDGNLMKGQTNQKANKGKHPIEHKG